MGDLPAQSAQRTGRTWIWVAMLVIVAFVGQGIALWRVVAFAAERQAGEVRISTLEADSRRLGTEVGELTSSTQAGREEFAQLKKQLDPLRAQVEQAKSDLVRAIKERGDAEGKAASALAMAKQSEGELASLRHRIAEAKTDANNVEKKQAEMQETIRDLANDHRKALEAKDELASVTALLGVLRPMVREAEVEYGLSRRTAEEARKMVIETRGQLENLRTEVAQVQKDLKDGRSELASLDLDAKRRESQSLDQRIKELKSAEVPANEAAVAVAAKRKADEAALDELRQQRDNLNTQVSSLMEEKRRAGRLTAENDALATASSARAELARVEEATAVERNAKAVAAAATAELRLQTTMEECSRADSRLAALGRQVSDFERRTTDAMTASRTADIAVVAATERLRKAEETEKALQRQIAGLRGLFEAVPEAQALAKAREAVRVETKALSDEIEQLIALRDHVVRLKAALPPDAQQATTSSASEVAAPHDTQSSTQPLAADSVAADRNAAKSGKAN